MCLKMRMSVVQLTTSVTRKRCKYTKLCGKDDLFTLVNECYDVIDMVWFSKATTSTKAVTIKKSTISPSLLKSTKILSG